MKDSVDTIINFLNNNNTAFSGWAVALFTLVLSFIIFIFKWLYTKNKKHKSIIEMLNDTSRNDIYSKCELAEALEIKKSMKENFPDYKDFLLIQYGSSVESNTKLPNDIDFIVLMLGHSTKEVKYLHNKGSLPTNTNIKHEIYIDVVYRDYLSFLFSASAGMPYENSVIVNSKLVHGHKGYYGWLKNITKNILIDRDFLLRRYDEKLCVERDEFLKCKREMNDFGHPQYNVIRAGYYYITSFLQKDKIKSFDKVIDQTDIIQLANVRNFYDSFTDCEIKQKYIKLVENLKRNNGTGEISIDDIEKIIINVDLK